LLPSDPVPPAERDDRVAHDGPEQPHSADEAGPSSTAGRQLLYESAGGIGRITINRPERRNAMSWEVVAGLRESLSAARSDPEVRVVVLGGAGDEAFCSGADLGGMVGEDFLSVHEARGQLAGVFGDLWQLGKPTIARVQGWALAGGFGLALACDMVVASDRARFGAPEINVGLWPYMITVPMARSMPPKKALELMLTGRVVEAIEAERIGFVNSVVPHMELDSAVEQLASDLATKSPAVMKLGRGAFYAVWDMAAADALSHLHAMLTLNTQTEDAEEGIAAFLEKRKPNWSGR